MQLSSLWQHLGKASVYYPQLAEITGGTTATILWLALLERVDANGEVTLAISTLSEATGLTRAEQEFARRLLSDRALIEVIIQDGSAHAYTLHLKTFEQYLVQPKSERSSVRTPKTDAHFPNRRTAIATHVTPNYRFSGPWETQEQFEAFQRALLDYAKQQGIQQASGWAFKIIDGISKGIVSPFWDDFINSRPLGESQQVQYDWEGEPGVPYPAFEEERIQYYVHKGEPIEAATAKARRDLRDPVLGKDLWEGFLRKCDRLADDALRAQRLGVETPYLPPAFSERSQPTKEKVMQKLSAIAAATKRLSAAESKPKLPSQSSEKLPRPDLESLQKIYATPLGQQLVKQQIEKHPHWGYKIVDGEVIESEDMGLPVGTARMKPLREVDPFTPGRLPLSRSQRQQERNRRRQQEREEGYQLLSELCYIGEAEMAKRISRQNARWGYEIVGDEVVERELNIEEVGDENIEF